MSKQELLDQVWDGRAVADNVLSVSIAKLRGVLDQSRSGHKFIETYYGQGYRFVPEVTRMDPAAPLSDPVWLTKVTTVPSQTSPLVGRADSLRTLQAALLRTIKGRGGMCVVLGEPGIGKTRLAESLEWLAGATVHVVWARYRQTENVPPLWPFVRMLRELNSNSVADEIVQFLAERSAEYETRSSGPGASDRLSHEFASAASAHAHCVLDATLQALIRISKQRPVVLLLDDLQWADALTLRLLDFLLDEIVRCRLLVVATLRRTRVATVAMEGSRDREVYRLLRHRHCRRIELAALLPCDVSKYVTTIAGSEREELSRAVFARSEGNPFLMVELLREWDPEREPPRDAEKLKLSGLAQGVLQQRLRELPEEARRMLSAAAVVGHDFDLGLVSCAMERNGDELLEPLDDLLAHDTIVASVDGTYAFNHELTREVLYSALPVAERCRLHLRVGHALSQRRIGGAAVSDAQLAHHYLSALPYGDVASAVEYARRAANSACDMSASIEARALLRRALAALSLSMDAEPEQRAGLLIQLAMVERALADPKSISHLAEGVAIAREHRCGSLLTEAGRLLSSSPGFSLSSDAASVLEAGAEVIERDRRRGAPP